MLEHVVIPNVISGSLGCSGRVLCLFSRFADPHPFHTNRAKETVWEGFKRKAKVCVF